ncbi:hypothetical protein L6452_19328 [Arctium lappa]|uniref:Uncharacterized protein n=1 Tax=Arctium lappa TaxID=4217 RepID=A0ACB9B9H8_ARCLA|nr:hypothetical protein L6452_19328 [Arctium lappa]
MCNPRLRDNRDLKNKKVVVEDSMFVSLAVRRIEPWDRVVTVRYGNYSDNRKWEVIGSCMRQGIVEAFLLGKEPIDLTKGDVGRLIDARFRGRNLFQGWEDCNTPTFERFEGVTEQVVVLSFLIGLRLEFDSIRSQFLNESAIPPLQETFAHVLRNENLQSFQTLDHNSALVSRGGFHGGFRGGSCGGHIGGSRCGHSDRPTDSRATIPDSDDVECYYCHEFGHTKRTCKKLLARHSRSSSAHVASASDNTVTIPVEEYARLLGTENSTAPTVAFAKTGNSSTCLLSFASKWVIDSGDSDYMTGNPTLFSNSDKHMSPSHVTIVDGSTPPVLGYGTIDLTPSVSLSSDLLTKRIIGRGQETDKPIHI